MSALAKAMGVNHIKYCARIVPDMAEHHGSIKGVAKRFINESKILENDKFEIIDKYSIDLKGDIDSKKYYDRCYKKTRMQTLQYFFKRYCVCFPQAGICTSETDCNLPVPPLYRLAVADNRKELQQISCHSSSFYRHSRKRRKRKRLFEKTGRIFLSETRVRQILKRFFYPDNLYENPACFSLFFSGQEQQHNLTFSGSPPLP